MSVVRKCTKIQRLEKQKALIWWGGGRGAGRGQTHTHQVSERVRRWGLSTWSWVSLRVPLCAGHGSRTTRATTLQTARNRVNDLRCVVARGGQRPVEVRHKPLFRPPPPTSGVFLLNAWPLTGLLPPIESWKLANGCGAQTAVRKTCTLTCANWRHY
jgi:hypothetical protein